MTRPFSGSEIVMKHWISRVLVSLCDMGRRSQSILIVARLISCFTLIAPQGFISSYLASVTMCFGAFYCYLFILLRPGPWCHVAAKGHSEHPCCLLWGPRELTLQGDPWMVPDTKSNCVAIACVLAIYLDSGLLKVFAVSSGSWPERHIGLCLGTEC